MCTDKKTVGQVVMYCINRSSDLSRDNCRTPSLNGVSTRRQIDPILLACWRTWSADAYPHRIRFLVDISLNLMPAIVDFANVLRLWFCWENTDTQIHKWPFSVSANVFSFAHRLMCICLVRKVVLLVNTQIHITKWPKFYRCICKFLFVAQINVPGGTSICATNRNLQIHK
jgi:hypothetical protein